MDGMARNQLFHIAAFDFGFFRNGTALNLDRTSWNIENSLAMIRAFAVANVALVRSFLFLLLSKNTMAARAPHARPTSATMLAIVPRILPALVWGRTRISY